MSSWTLGEAGESRVAAVLDVDRVLARLPEADFVVLRDSVVAGDGRAERALSGEVMRLAGMPGLRVEGQLSSEVALAGWQAVLSFVPGRTHAADPWLWVRYRMAKAHAKQEHRERWNDTTNRAWIASAVVATVGRLETEGVEATPAAVLGGLCKEARRNLGADRSLDPVGWVRTVMGWQSVDVTSPATVLPVSATAADDDEAEPGWAGDVAGVCAAALVADGWAADLAAEAATLAVDWVTDRGLAADRRDLVADMARWCEVPAGQARAAVLVLLGQPGALLGAESVLVRAVRAHAQGTAPESRAADGTADVAAPGMADPAPTADSSPATAPCGIRVDGERHHPRAAGVPSWSASNGDGGAPPSGSAAQAVPQPARPREAGRRSCRSVPPRGQVPAAARRRHKPSTRPGWPQRCRGGGPPRAVRQQPHDIRPPLRPTPPGAGPPG